jgi:CHAT domain-containing protein
LEITDSIGCKEYPFCLNLYLSASFIYLKNEDFTRSLEFAKIGEKFSKANNDKISNNYISFLSTQSQCYNALGNYPKAIDIANNVYLLRKNSDTTTSFFHHNLANALKNLGDVCQNLNFTDCEKYYLNALNEYKQAVGTNHSYYIQTLSNLADYELLKGDTVNASYDYNLQLSLALKSNEISIEERYGAAIKFCRFLQNIEKFDESIKYINGLINDMESINMIGSNYLNALFILANNYSGLKNYDKSIEINLKIIELYKIKNTFNQNDFDKAIQNLSNQYLLKGDTINAEKLMRQKIDNQINNYTKLSMDLNRLQTVGFKWSIEEDIYSVFSYVYDTKRFNTPFGKYILERVLGFKNIFNSNENKLIDYKFDINELQKKISKSVCYTEIIRIPYFSFNIKKFKYQTTYFLINIDSKRISVDSINISSDIEDYISFNQQEFNLQSCHFDSKIYNLIWKPIADKIGDAKTIYVSLGGVYNNINLNTIYNPSTGKYLMEEKDIRIVNSARDFVFSKESEKKKYTTNTASLFGFPNFDGNNTVYADSSDLYASTRNLNSFWLDSLTRGGMKAKPLPATKTEVENISATLKSKGWQVNSFLADNASETNIKKQQSPRILHVATHGYFFQDIPIEKDNNRFLGMDRQQLVQDPMLRSGLLLTGANKTLKGETTSGENGLLSAAEASLLDLRETELVVLSACETGKGEIKNSEGVYGLRKAFSDAGAQNIIMSLWKVDDKVTQEFMSRFYEIWLNEKTSIRESFNKTQLEIKTKYPQPYYWGAFILVGE